MDECVLSSGCHAHHRAPTPSQNAFLFDFYFLKNRISVLGEKVTLWRDDDDVEEF